MENKDTERRVSFKGDDTLVSFAENETLVQVEELSDCDSSIPSEHIVAQKNSLRKFRDKLSSFHVISLVILIFLIVFVIIFSLVSHLTGTNASLIGLRESHRHHTCDEEKFGCCKIYLQCTDKHTYLDYKDITLDHYRVLPRSRDHSNCPSLEYLIAEYNEHYGVNDDDCGEYGCCENSYDIGCDKTIRGTFKTGNNEDTISYLQNNSKIIEIKIARENKEGTNCMNHNGLLGDIIYSYDTLYPDKSGSTDIIAVILIIVSFWFLVVCICGGRK
jgi:hypothetical protein